MVFDCYFGRRELVALMLLISVGYFITIYLFCLCYWIIKLVDNCTKCD